MNNLEEDWKEDMYDMFLNYFGNLPFTKIKNMNNESIYFCRIKCLMNINRYIICVVNKDNYEKGYVQKLIDLKWLSIQTRELEEYHNIPQHTYNANREYPYNSVILRVKDEKDYCTYISQLFPISITLLKTKNKQVYNEKGTILSALETYQTIVMLKK